MYVAGLRIAYPAVLLLGFNGAAFLLVERGASKLWLVALLLLAIALSFAVERLIPYDAEWNHGHDDSGRDVAHALVNEVEALAAIAALPVLAELLAVPGAWPDGWPFAIQVLAAILVFDLGVTLVHYASHHVGALWRLHAVHHSVKRQYGFNGLMKHPLHQALELAGGVAPLLLLGLPQDVAYLLAFATGIQLLLQHSNADYTVGRLRYVLSLNEGHRFHHLKWAGVGDVNFGLFTLVWDHILGTFSYDPERRFTSDDLGIAAEPEFPSGYLAQLREPFRTGSRPR